MQVHNDLKELLKSYHNHLNKIDNFGNDNPELTAKMFLDFNSLASVEPEPLAKNKHTESCNHPLDTLTKMFGGMYCDECKSYVNR